MQSIQYFLWNIMQINIRLCIYFNEDDRLVLSYLIVHAFDFVKVYPFEDYLLLDL